MDTYNFIMWTKYLNNVVTLFSKFKLRSVSYRRASVKLGSSGAVRSRKHKSVVESVIPSTWGDVGDWGLVSSTDGDREAHFTIRRMTNTLKQ